MLQGISKLLTGDLLKALCDMGHGDELVIADANFPGERVARRLIRLPGISGTELLRAIAPLIPLDAYSPAPALVMQLTDSDRAKGMPDPAIWGEYEAYSVSEGYLIRNDKLTGNQWGLTRFGVCLVWNIF